MIAFIYCSSPLDIRRPDMDYEREYNTAKSLGANVYLIDHDSLVRDNDINCALKRIPENSNQIYAIYRGWMMWPEQYEVLYNGLMDIGIKLVNNPYTYKLCHLLPESYSLIQDWTPKSIWIAKNELRDTEFAFNALDVFGTSSVIIKDYVKSCKYDWESACYIPNASDRVHAQKVINRFLELQGDSLTGGLVIREFINCEIIGMHNRSNLPLTNEHRFFYSQGDLIFEVNYWDDVDYTNLEKPPIDWLNTVASKIDSNFYTIDVAHKSNGEWMVVELGDGQVSGIPDHTDIEMFYNCIIKIAPAM